MYKPIRLSLFIFLAVLVNPVLAKAELKVTLSECYQYSGDNTAYFDYSIENNLDVFFPTAAIKISALDKEGNFLGDNLLLARNLRTGGVDRSDRWINNVECADIARIEVQGSDGLTVRNPDTGDDIYPYSAHYDSTAALRQEIADSVRISTQDQRITMVWRH